MAKGTQAKLGRSGARKPKVHITFDVEEGDAEKSVELPFVVGVMADLSNRDVVDEDGDKIPIEQRGFKDVSRDNFGEMMKKISPEASVRVENKLDASGGKIGGKLVFKSMDDFRPDNVARQLPGVKEILEVREQLANIKRRIDGNQKLEKELKSIIQKTMEAAPGTQTDAGTAEEE